MPRDLRGRVLIVTGASAGIGAATALAAAAAGMDVLVTARREDRLRELAGRVRALGRRAEWIAGDATEAGFSDRLLDLAESRLGRFDAVLANAGYGYYQPMHEMTSSDLRRMFDVNFFAATELVCEAARRLIARRQPGHLLMTSSCLARFTLEDFAAYSATKAAQSHVCRAMRIELRRHRIDVSCVHPITTATEFLEAAESQTQARNSPAIRRRVAPAWMVQPAERVADAIVACLRRPRAEVWTAFLPRLLAGAMTVFPSLQDRFGPMRLD